MEDSHYVISILVPMLNSQDRYSAGIKQTFSQQKVTEKYTPAWMVF